MYSGIRDEISGRKNIIVKKYTINKKKYMETHRNISRYHRGHFIATRSNLILI